MLEENYSVVFEEVLINLSKILGNLQVLDCYMGSNGELRSSVESRCLSISVDMLYSHFENLNNLFSEISGCDFK